MLVGTPGFDGCAGMGNGKLEGYVVVNRKPVHGGVNVTLPDSGTVVSLEW